MPQGTINAIHRQHETRQQHRSLRRIGRYPVDLLPDRIELHCVVPLPDPFPAIVLNRGSAAGDTTIGLGEPAGSALEPVQVIDHFLIVAGGPAIHEIAFTKDTRPHGDVVAHDCVARAFQRLRDPRRSRKAIHHPVYGQTFQQPQNCWNDRLLRPVYLTPSVTTAGNTFRLSVVLPAPSISNVRMRYHSPSDFSTYPTAKSTTHICRTPDALQSKSDETKCSVKKQLPVTA